MVKVDFRNTVMTKMVMRGGDDEGDEEGWDGTYLYTTEDDVRAVFQGGRGCNDSLSCSLFGKYPNNIII